MTMHMKLKTLCLMMALMIALTGTAMAASGQHEVTASKLYFREDSSAESEALATLRKGTVVTVLSTSGGWAKARWDGQEGYLSYEYLQKVTGDATKGGNTTELSGTAYADGSVVLYEAADVASETLATLADGTRLSLRGETMKFYYVKADGQTGYVLKSKTEMTKNASASSSSDDDAQDAPQTAESELIAKAKEKGWLCLGCQSDEVKRLQERLAELDYMSSSLNTGYFGELTDAAVREFQKDHDLDVDGVVGPATEKQLGSSEKADSDDDDDDDDDDDSIEVVEMDWYDSDVSDLVYKRGGTAKIIDCETGVVINIRRVGGSNHMDVEPKTAEDTEKLLKLYGGEWSWDRRAVILVADGKYIAASINGMPHGDQISTTNNFDGQFCLHTTNSRTHGTDSVNSDHQDAIEDALRYDG